MLLSECIHYVVKSISTLGPCDEEYRVWRWSGKSVGKISEQRRAKKTWLNEDIVVDDEEYPN